MFAAIWDKLAEGLSSTWNTRVLAPVLAFWGGGVMAWVWKNGWDPIVNLVNRADTIQGIAMAVAILILLTVSSGLIEWCTLPVLRLAEGYWPGLLKWLRFYIAARLSRKLEAKEDRWKALAADYQAGKLDARGLEKYAHLDAELATYPVDRAFLLPTRLGNMLRAAEEYPYVRYGLEVTIVWPRLWSVLPESANKDIMLARQVLDERTQIMTWGLLFAIWGIWAWWAIPLALGVAIVAYRGILDAARVYGERLRAAFDLYRFALYKSLNWPLPASAMEECDHGRRLSEYLHRGFTRDIRYGS